MKQLYVIYRYRLSVTDVQYVKVRKGDRIEWVNDKAKASVFKKERADALARGYKSAGGVDLVVEPLSFWNP